MASHDTDDIYNTENSLRLQELEACAQAVQRNLGPDSGFVIQPSGDVNFWKFLPQSTIYTDVLETPPTLTREDRKLTKNSDYPFLGRHQILQTRKTDRIAALAGAAEDDPILREDAMQALEKFALLEQDVAAGKISGTPSKLFVVTPYVKQSNVARSAIPDDIEPRPCLHFALHGKNLVKYAHTVGLIIQQSGFASIRTAAPTEQKQAKNSLPSITKSSVRLPN